MKDPIVEKETLKVKFSKTQPHSREYKVKFSECQPHGKKSNFNVGFSEFQQITIETKLYEGSYEVEPTRDEQILNTNGLKMEKDVVIKPIPKEYGLVTYNQDKTIRIT